MFKPWGSGTLCSNPGFWNYMFEPWVRELYVRTRGLENSMFEPRVRELLPPPRPQRVRTLGSGTRCSNPGFGELYAGTPGSGSPPPPREFEPGFGNPMFKPGVKFGNSMFRQTSKSS